MEEIKNIEQVTISEEAFEQEEFNDDYVIEDDESYVINEDVNEGNYQLELEDEAIIDQSLAFKQRRDRRLAA